MAPPPSISSPFRMKKTLSLFSLPKRDPSYLFPVINRALLKELTDSAGDIQFGEGQEVELKGLAGPNRVYAVDWR